jgi:hypothetical protein
MRCLYQKDEWALPGILQNRKYRFFLSYSHQMYCLSLLPPLLSLSLVWFSQQIATVSLNSINRLGFVGET